MIWETLTSPALDAVDRRVPVVLPIAAIEQHGPHLPLATDKIINEHFCRALDEAVGQQVLLLPTISVTCSRHHMDFPGTLTVTHETLASYMCETLESVAAHGFHNLIIFNSHGGNLAVAGVALEKFGSLHPECRLVLATWWRIAGAALGDLNVSGPGGVGHAGEFETSLLLLAAPELVDEPAIQPKQNTSSFSWAEIDMLRPPRAALYRSMKQMTPNGAHGDPTAASREKGTAITQLVVDALSEIVTDLKG